MPKKETIYRTIHTIEGITMHIFEDDKGVTKPHCATGPAILYSKKQRKQDEYYIFGVKYDYDKWLELSRPLRKAEPKEDLQDE